MSETNPTPCASCERIGRLFEDAGQGEHNVLALIDYYQRLSMDADERLRAVRALLEEHCGCACGSCLACRIGQAVRGEAAGGGAK